MSFLLYNLAFNNIFQSKETLEAYRNKVGVTIKHYHAENCRFQNNIFIPAIMDEIQRIYFYRVNAQIHNVKTEKRIRDLQEYTRKQIQNAK